VALAGKGDDSATTGTFVGVGEGEGLATVGVGVAEGLAAVGVGVATVLVDVAVGVGGALAGVAVLSTDNSARGSWALPCPGRGRTVGGLEGTSVAVSVAVGVAVGV
jgi:hypothetical protein